MSASKISSAAFREDGDTSKKDAEGDNDDKDSSSSGHPKRSASPEATKCAICLGDVVNRSCSNACVHQFCFGCLLEWSKVKPECPLCKSSFRSIYHNFRSNNEYDEHVVPTPVPHLSIRFTASGANYRLSPFIRVLERAAHQHSPLAHAFDSVSIPAGMFQPPPPPVVLTTNPFNNGSSSTRPEYFGDLVSEHRRVQEEAVQMPGYQNRRRRYDRNEWVQPFGSTLQAGSAVLQSMDYIRTHPTAGSRLRNWLYRELNVLLGLYRSRDQMAFVYDLIMHLINHYDVRSRDFRDMVSNYFGAKTAHFQHELFHFILSGMSMEEYDRVAEYPSPNSSSRNLARRNIPPEVITIESDEENGTTRNRTVAPPQPRTEGESDDIILLDTSSDEDAPSDAYPVRSRLSTSFQGSNRSYADVAAALTMSSFSSRISALPLSNDGTQESARTMPDLISIGLDGGDRDRARQQTGRSFNIDPEMPILEPQIFPFGSLEDSFPSVEDSTTIDRLRATAATTTVTTSSSNQLSTLPSAESINQNLIRPSVLSSSSGRISNSDMIRVLEPEFDINLDVSVESYSSPPRQSSRPLASPDFPILQLRRSIGDRDRNVWERSSRAATASSAGCPFSGFGNESRRSSSRVTANASAFVPYEPEVSHLIREEPPRPPRPSCIHGTGSSLLSNSSTSSSREYRPNSPTPAFRIDLYPRGMSSSQVMDLSRSAGLISTMSSSRSTATYVATTAPSNYLTSSDVSSMMEAIAGPSSASSIARSFMPQERKHTPPETNDNESDADELECLGTFPIEKKPPLAVITLSSDDEEETRIKTERQATYENNKQERLNLLSSDDETNLLDGFMNWEHSLVTDFNLLEEPSSPPVIDFQSSSSSSSFLNIAPVPQLTATSSASARRSSLSGSAIISIPNIPSFRLSVKSKTTSTSQNPGEGTSTSNQPAASSGKSERHKKKHKRSSPKKSKSKRLRVISSSDDDSDEEEILPKRVKPSTSQTLSPVKIPKKRKYPEIEIPASPVPPVAPSLSTSESSGGSERSTDSENDDDDFEFDVIDHAPKTKTSTGKKRSSSSKKHKSKSKKSKKSKKGKDKSKEKEKTKKSRTRSGSKVKPSSADSSSASLDVASSGSGGSSSKQPHHRSRRGTTGAASATATKPTVQAPTTSPSSSFSFSSTSVMNIPICDFEYPSGLLDLSFNSRTEEDDTPLLPHVGDDEQTIDLRIPPPPPPAIIEPSVFASTVDTSAIFGSPSRAIFNAFWDDYSSLSSNTERRNSSWME